MGIDVRELVGDSVLLLSSSVSFIVPSTEEKSETITAAEFAKRTAGIAAAFNSLFGGATITAANGYDVHNPKGEDVRIVQSFSDSETLADSIPQLLALARKKCADWSQGAIARQLLIVD
jgi:hypothetical protein